MLILVGYNKFDASDSSALTQLPHPKYENTKLMVCLLVTNSLDVSHDIQKLVIL